MARINLSYTIRGTVDPVEPETIDFRLTNIASPWRTRDYLFATGGDNSTAVRFSSSNNNIAKVHLIDSVWVLDYMGVGTATITCTKGQDVFSKVVTVVDPPKGRIVNVGTGSGDVTISRAALSLLDGDTVVLKEGTYGYINIQDIIVPDGNPRIEIITDGYVRATKGIHSLNLRNVTVDGSRVQGMKHGIAFTDNTTQDRATLRNVNHCIFRNIKFQNVNTWAYKTDNVSYDGTEGSYLKDNQFINILSDNAKGFTTQGGINVDTYGIEGLCVDFKFIGWELKNTSPGYAMYIPAGQGILFDQFTVDNVNANDNKHNGVFFVGGHADITRSKFVNHQGNAIRLWPFSIVDGNLSNGTALRTAKFINNIIFRSRVYSAFEIQGFDNYYQEGLTKGVHLVVANNTAGHLGLANPAFFVAKLVDRYSNGVDGQFYAYNNILAKTMGTGGGFFQYYETTSQTLADNRLYADFQEAKFDPANFTLDESSTAWGVGVRNQYTNEITVDFYGNPIEDVFSMGAVQQTNYVLPASLPGPTTPSVATLFDSVSASDNKWKEFMILAVNKSESPVGINNYDIEVNNQIYTTAAGYPRIGRQANYSHPNVPFLEDGAEYLVRFRARDFRGNLSGWSDYFMARTADPSLDGYQDMTLEAVSGGSITKTGDVYSTTDAEVIVSTGVTIPPGKAGRIVFTPQLATALLGWSKDPVIDSSLDIEGGIGTYDDRNDGYVFIDGQKLYTRPWANTLMSLYFHYSGEVVMQKSTDGGYSWEFYSDGLFKWVDQIYTGDKFIHVVMKSGEVLNNPQYIIYDGVFPGLEPVEPEPEIGEEERIEYSAEAVDAVTFNTRWDSGQQFVHHRSVRNLADQSYIVDVNNAPTGFPTNTPVVHQSNYGIYSALWYNSTSFDFTIDLEGIYDVTKIFYTMGAHSSTGFWIWGSLDGYSKDNLLFGTNKISAVTSSWFNVPIDLAKAANIRYLIIGVDYGDVRFNGIVVYGKKKVSYRNKGFKNKRNVPLRSFTEGMGTNAFLQEKNFDMISNTSSIVRYYNDSGWLVSSYAGVTLLPEQIKMMPKTSHMWNFDTKLQEAKDLGQKVLFCFKKTPNHLGHQGPDRGGNEATPTDPGLNARDISVTSDPMSYKHMARIAFLFAARYGKNSDIDPIYDAQFTDANPPYGLDLFEYFEVGNEPDGYWKGEDQISMPIELAALYSAVYDGHKGAMGPGFGIKAADPNMKLANGGFSGIERSWFRQMMNWWDENRGVGDYPIQVFNTHYYSAWKRETVTPTYSDIPAYAVPPEKGLYISEVKDLMHVRDKQAPNAEIWVTETGYDEHYGGMYSPPDRQQTPRSRHKAAWIMRTFLAINKYTEAITQYWYGDDWVRLADYNPDVVQREKFMTTGYVEGITAANDRNRRPLTTYWYIVSFKADMQGYYFSHAVVENGVELTTESLGFDLHPELWVYAFKKINGDSCLVVWMGADDWKTHNTRVYVSEPNVEVIDYVEHEVRQVLVGNVTDFDSIPDGDSSYIDVTVTEYPMIIKTNDIGIGKLVSPANLKITNNLLTWDDFNVGSNATEVYSSSLPDSGFTLIHSSALLEAKYVLPLSSNQHYRVRFVNDVSFSDFSVTVSK